jgi:hypothetical protein
MAGKATRHEEKVEKKDGVEITFLCRRCGKNKPISKMRTVTRFVPMLIVCQDCARELR